MPSAKKNRRKTINYTNKKKMWKKVKQKTQVHIPCEQIKNSWDSKKTVKQNLSEMGIAVNPNAVLPIPKPYVFPTIIAEESKPVVVKPTVLKEMELEAEQGEKERNIKLPADNVLFCIYMLDKYKEDYKAMARDKRNAYQLTPKQIRHEIREFKRSKQQYQKYLDSKREQIVNDEVMQT
uniref:Nucleolar protein 16 n=1 Tax=Ciona savignyi TaxID=51511 RepID=H2Y569_CIOSA